MTTVNIFPDYPSSLLPANPEIYFRIWDYYYTPVPPSKDDLPVDTIQALVLNELALAFRKNRDLNLFDRVRYPVLSKRICLCKMDLNLTLARSNVDVREALKYKNQSHIENTRKQIMKGAGHLNPEKSVVIVCGAQLSGDNKEALEPLQELADRCFKIVFTDCDESTLKLLASKITPPSKVLTETLDLSGGFQDELVKLTAVAQEFKLMPNWVMLSLLMLWKEFSITTQIGATENPFQALLKEHVHSVDYVVTSLVASELSSGHRELDWMFNLLFKQKTSVFLNMMNSNSPEMALLYGRLLDQNVNNLGISHLGNVCSWVTSRGCVYFADTTTILQHNIQNYIGKSKLYPATIERIKGFANKHVYKNWQYTLPSTVYKVESWILSQFILNYAEEKSATAETASASATTSSAGITAASAGTATAAAGTTTAFSYEASSSSSDTALPQEAERDPKNATGSN